MTNTKAAGLIKLSEEMRGRISDASCDLLFEAGHEMDQLTQALIFSVGNAGGVEFRSEPINGVQVDGMDIASVTPIVASAAPEAVRSLLYAAALKSQMGDLS